MQTHIKTVLTLTLTLSAIGVLAFTGQSRAAEALTDAQKAEVMKMMEEYIMDNGDKIMESVRLHQEKQAKAADAKAEQKIQDHMAKLTAADAPSAGNPKSDVTVIEFFDYNCGYCRKVVPDVQKLIDTDKNVRFVFKEMPILGPTSKTAAEWALAAHKQGKYFEYHVALMNHKGPKNEAVLQQLAKKVGLDVEQMKKDAASKEIQDKISESMKIASDIGIRGTPAFIIDGKLFRGYLGDDGLKSAVEEARKNNEG